MFELRETPTGWYVENEANQRAPFRPRDEAPFVPLFQNSGLAEDVRDLLNEVAPDAAEDCLNEADWAEVSDTLGDVEGCETALNADSVCGRIRTLVEQRHFALMAVALLVETHDSPKHRRRQMPRALAQARGLLEKMCEACWGLGGEEVRGGEGACPRCGREAPN